MATCEQEYSLINRLKYMKNNSSLILTNCSVLHHFETYCSASEFRHPSEVRHLYFMTVLKLLYDLPANNYTLLSKTSIPLFKMWI